MIVETDTAVRSDFITALRIIYHEGLSDAFAHLSARSEDGSEMLFMPLIKFNEKIEPIPWLAERWDTVRVAPDSLDLTFHVRRDVKWHDGQPTTAKDVLFS